MQNIIASAPARQAHRVDILRVLKRTTPDPRSSAYTDRLALTGSTPQQFCLANVRSQNNAREKIAAAYIGLLKDSQRITERAIQRASGCSIHTVRRHRLLFAGDAVAKDLHIKSRSETMRLAPSGLWAKVWVSFFASLLEQGRRLYRWIAKPHCQCGCGHEQLPLRIVRWTAERSEAAIKKALAQPGILTRKEIDMSYQSWKPSSMSQKPPGSPFGKKEKDPESLVMPQPLTPPEPPPRRRPAAMPPRPIVNASSPIQTHAEYINMRKIAEPCPDEVKAQLKELTERLSMDTHTDVPRVQRVESVAADEDWFRRNIERIPQRAAPYIRR